MRPSRFILAVDGGGTKTAAALYGPGGERLVTAAAGPCNLFQDLAGGIAAVDRAWEAACAAAGLEPRAVQASTCLSVGLAGIHAPGAAAAFAHAFKSFDQILMSSDGYIALVGACRGRPGALLVTGTGVVGHRLNADGSAMALGGWGFPVGDRGGGAWLGFTLVGDWLEATEGSAARAGDTPLWDEAARAVGTTPAQILAWLHEARPADFAALAPAIVSAAQAGDRYARTLLAAATRHILRLAEALEPVPAAPLHLTGGLAHVFADSLERMLGEAAIIRDRMADPLEGALLIGQGLARPEIGPIAGETLS